jgi:Parvulin-like peptidyl-prolyl isomerase
MRKLIGLSGAGLVAVLVLAGCGGKDDVVAKIGSEKLKTSTVEERLQETPPSYQSYLNTEAGRKQFLDLLVRERVVVASAKKAGVKNRAEYKKALADFKKDQARRARDYEENLAMELYIRDLNGTELNVTDQDVEKYYNDHIAEYKRPVEVVARHILVPTQEEAEKALDRVKKGENFAKVAREVSADPISAERGGEIGPFRKGDLVPEFEDAAFPLKVGQVSPIIKTQFGYHIIKRPRKRRSRPVHSTMQRPRYGRSSRKPGSTPGLRTRKRSLT